MADQEKTLNHLSEVFHTIASNLNGKADGALHQFQKSSFKSLQEVQFPNRKHEDWKYTVVQNLINPLYQLAGVNQTVHMDQVPGLESHRVIVSNGRILWDQMDPKLKDSGIRLMAFDEMLEEEALAAVFKKMISLDIPSSNKAFEFLNFAFQSGGFAIEVPKNFKLDKPIEIQIIHDDPEVSFSHPLYFILAREGSNISIIERFEENKKTASPSTPGLINASAYLFLEKNATINHYRWQNLPSTQTLVYKLSVSQSRDSRFDAFGFDYGGLTVRNNIDLELEDSNTYSSLYAAYISRNKQSIDHQTRINHKMPHCESHELYKGIIDDQASGAFNGKVYVHPDAQKTNAFQQNDSLVLSANARMNSKPQLEIYADDVKCSHGATIGQMDEKSLFYLMSRGINKEAAKHMLKSAFIAEVLDAVTIEPLRNHIRLKMSSAL